MCGIVGYVGTKKATPILINGLLKLEYRGYDSAGIACVGKDEILCIKNKGRVNELNQKLKESNVEGNIGIAHTRWATHGRPSTINSHPHMDSTKTFSIVHNGIIENYNELREFLIQKGYNFLSETDTEVIPNLIHYNFLKLNEDDESRFIKAVKNTCNDLKGSYALEVISTKYPDRIIVTRKDSPLVIGLKDDENYISSDIPAVLSYTKSFYILNDNEYAQVYKDKVTIYNDSLEIIKKQIEKIDWDASAAEKNGYEDFMLKEINEQPKSIRETIGSRIRLDDICLLNEINFSKEDLLKFNKIYIVACGTAMHAGLLGKGMIESLCKIPVEVDIASEFRYRNPIVDDNMLAIYISQSGETADTIAALKLAKSKGAKTIAISNVIGSSITREAHHSIYTYAGPEISVASTKAYTSQVVLLSILAIYFAEILGTSDTETIKFLKKNILELPIKIESVLDNVEPIKQFAEKIYKEKDMFFLGRGIDYFTALEGSLKLKEITYIHSEAYAAGELKHGPIALIEDDVTVISIMTNPLLIEKTVSNIQEVITRGAKNIVITNQDIEEKHYELVIKIPEISPMFSSVLAIVPLQLLSYYISKKKGLDVDKPRNLAKSVTVE